MKCKFHRRGGPFAGGTCLNCVPRKRRTTIHYARHGELAGFSIGLRQRSGHVWLEVWTTGRQGAPLIGADLGPRQRKALIRLLGGTP